MSPDHSSFTESWPFARIRYPLNVIFQKRQSGTFSKMYTCSLSLYKLIFLASLWLIGSTKNRRTNVRARNDVSVVLLVDYIPVNFAVHRPINCRIRLSTYDMIVTRFYLELKLSNRVLNWIFFWLIKRITFFWWGMPITNNRGKCSLCNTV